MRAYALKHHVQRDLVVSTLGDDDISLAPGNLRIRKKGSAGGQKGMKSIISHLGTSDFARIRVGVGHSNKGDHSLVPDWVLSPVPKAEQEDFENALKKAAEAAGQGRATVFGYYVNDPERFGIVEFDQNGKVLSVEEKPENPKSNYAITGLYFYPAGVAKKAGQVKPSARGELEITSLNEIYLQEELLNVELLGRGFAWLDTGTMDSLVEAADFVRMVEKRQGVKISAPEEIAYRYEWISADTLRESANRYGKSPYGEHLRSVADGRFYSSLNKKQG